MENDYGDNDGRNCKLSSPIALTAQMSGNDESV